MNDLTTQAFDLAVQARANAYVPISGFKVGAALVAGGEIYAGCNVEDGAFTSSIHAEQNALGQAIARCGKVVVSDIVVVADDPSKGVACLPCGHCLQLLSDFVVDDTNIVVFTPNQVKRFEGIYKDLVPHAFKFNKN